jgi:hypothetical protein
MSNAARCKLVRRLRDERALVPSAPESAHRQWGESPRRTDHRLSLAEGRPHNSQDGDRFLNLNKFACFRVFIHEPHLLPVYHFAVRGRRVDEVGREGPTRQT